MVLKVLHGLVKTLKLDASSITVVRVVGLVIQMMMVKLGQVIVRGKVFGNLVLIHIPIP